MSKLLLLPVLAVFLVLSAGCAKRVKSSARLYEGDSPTIHFTNEPETAGGRVNPY